MAIFNSYVSLPEGPEGNRDSFFGDEQEDEQPVILTSSACFSDLRPPTPGSPGVSGPAAGDMLQVVSHHMSIIYYYLLVNHIHLYNIYIYILQYLLVESLKPCFVGGVSQTTLFACATMSLGSRME